MQRKLSDTHNISDGNAIQVEPVKPPHKVRTLVSILAADAMYFHAAQQALSQAAQYARHIDRARRQRYFYAILPERRDTARHHLTSPLTS